MINFDDTLIYKDKMFDDGNAIDAYRFFKMIKEAVLKTITIIQNGGYASFLKDLPYTRRYGVIKGEDLNKVYRAKSYRGLYGIVPFDILPIYRTLLFKDIKVDHFISLPFASDQADKIIPYIDWIDIFKKDFCLAGNSEIVRLDIEKKSFEGTEPTTVYVDFAARFRNRKFDLISIDAPFGGNTLTYSRMDILELLPGCLKEDFVILLDDYNRPAERNMIEKLKGILKDNGISFHTGVYRGNKDTFIVSSENLRFLCTMWTKKLL